MSDAYNKGLYGGGAPYGPNVTDADRAAYRQGVWAREALNASSTHTTPNTSTPRRSTPDSKPKGIDLSGIPRYVSPEEKARMDQLKAAEFKQNVKYALGATAFFLVVGAGIKAYQWTDANVIQPVKSFISSPAARPQPATASPTPAPVTPNTVYERQLSYFFEKHANIVNLTAAEMTHVSQGLVSRAAPASQTERKASIMRSHKTGDHYTLFTAPVTAGGPVRSVMCATNGSRIVAFSRATTTIDGGRTNITFENDIVTPGQKLNISTLAKQMVDCVEAVHDLDRKYGLGLN